MMKNVYDIRYEKNLIYILPEGMKKSLRIKYTKTAVILYLYYIDTLSFYYTYIDVIPNIIDMYIISLREEVLEAIRTHEGDFANRNVRYILKENRGRDVSALLVTSLEIVKNYQYICFLHDKKAREERFKKDTDLWIENLWVNMIGSPAYIDNLINLFEENKTLGILAPPDPIGDQFATWYGYGWYGSFGITRKIASELHLKADLRIDKPPITIGTALWFRREALEKLFAKRWSYDDFDDEELKKEDYLSYGIERIFAYVAQDAGYDTGTVMTTSYAEKQTNYLQYSTRKIFAEFQHYFPFHSISMIEAYKKSIEKMIHFAKNNQYFYLYGAGELGRFCHYVLREQNLLPVGYLVSEAGEKKVSEGLSVIVLSEISIKDDAGIIITVFEQAARESIRKNLERQGLYNYMEFWRQ